jgi:branched-chain amino acid transport system permease protein
MESKEQDSRWLERIVTLVDGKEVLLIFALVLFPLFLTGNFSLSTHVLIFAMFAMGYYISLGETGMLTFGHAAFFGLGAYGSAFWLVHVDAPPYMGFMGIITGVLLAVVGGIVIGALSLRRRGTYLALITLAFQQMLYFTFFQWESLTGGDDGLYGLSTPKIGIPGVFVLEFEEGLGGLVSAEMLFFAFVFVIFAVSVYAIRRLKQSKMGHVFNAVRENEDRADFLGYDVHNYRMMAFVASAGFAGLGGTLYPVYLNFVGLSTLNWVLSGEVNFFLLLGGISSFVGPVVGTMSYYWIVDEISAFTDHWQLFVGLIFIGLVLFLPEGIVGTIRDYVSERTSYTIHEVPPRSDE